MVKTISLFIEQDFNSYDLHDFSKFIDLINKCANDPELFRLLPYLLRNLFENLLYYLFRDGLDAKHTILFYNTHLNRSRDFSELISLLNILRDDPDFKKYHKDIITIRTIEYLKNIQKDGNIDVHSIITQLPADYASGKKEDINTLLRGLLPLYQVIKGKSVLIVNSITHSNIAKKLNLLTDLNIGNARSIIEDIKSMNKEEIGDLIVDLKSDKINEVIEKILVEIILIENFEEFKAKTIISDFVIYSIKIRKMVTEKIAIFAKMIETVISQNNHYIVERLQEEIPKLLDMVLLKKHCLDHNLLPEFIKLLCESNSFQIAGINAAIVSKLYIGLTKSDMDKIIGCALRNKQIYDSSKAQGLLGRLFILRQDIFDFNYNSKLKNLGMGIPDWMIL
ncbi:hypothetical protein LCGC14_0753790 [marine sediment metagenome]|uniref:Uncharacterized protein n=1 Tax=marine sediment metagenome TaxID=412755 RepID=A0A0F9QN27_9ZZZZ|nr:hypothetical protein [archaeon]